MNSVGGFSAGLAAGLGAGAGVGAGVGAGAIITGRAFSWAISVSTFFVSCAILGAVFCVAATCSDNLAMVFACACVCASRAFI